MISCAIFFVLLAFDLVYSSFASSISNSQNEVHFGSTEYYPYSVHKDQKLKNKGSDQLMIEYLIADQFKNVKQEEMTHLRQLKELGSTSLYCHVGGFFHDPLDIKRKRTSIEKYVDKDVFENKIKTLHSLPFVIQYNPGYIAIHKDRIQRFLKFAKKNTTPELLDLDGEKLTNQLDLKTGWYTGNLTAPKVVVNAAIEKRIFALETVMDFEYNFFRMVESHRIDFYYDAYGQFANNGEQAKNSWLLTKHPEFKNIISLKVKDFQQLEINYFECSVSSLKIIHLINSRLTKIVENENDYLNLIKKVFQFVYTPKQINFYIENIIRPTYPLLVQIHRDKDYFIGKKYDFLKKLFF